MNGDRKRDLTWPALIWYIVLVPTVYMIISPILSSCLGGDLQKTIQPCVALSSKNENQPLSSLAIKRYPAKKKKMCTKKEKPENILNFRKCYFGELSGTGCAHH